MSILNSLARGLFGSPKTPEKTGADRYPMVNASRLPAIPAANLPPPMPVAKLNSMSADESTIFMEKIIAAYERQAITMELDAASHMVDQLCFGDLNDYSGWQERIDYHEKRALEHIEIANTIIAGKTVPSYKVLAARHLAVASHHSRIAELYVPAE